MRTIFRSILPSIIMIPSIFFGIFTMYHNNVSSNLWLQNFAVLLLVSASSYLIISRKIFLKLNSLIIIIVGILLLLLTFTDNGLSNVYRWLSIGIINLNIGSIVLPLLLIELEKNLNFKNWWLITLLAFGIIAILSFQPDASKATAFALASLFFTQKYVTNKIQYVVLAIPIMASVWTWYFLDDLPPVNYVEEILQMTKGIGTTWYIFSVLSLILLPIPFFIFKTEKNKSICISLGIYFSVVLLSTLFGNFPVPLLGYGISPIIGYSIAITWLIKNTDFKYVTE
ncbi:hypothetical protein [uncultured Aquimarina sp.]|uniref:hypothetical protein n=1 Tax=uncultured Aquimarina sp. TaxID=575652 RepID=UPI00260993EF|nr:hypothetical protein [uncultured Aquimarina sp.]